MTDIMYLPLENHIIIETQQLLNVAAL